jgi:hypothetical protein
MAGLGEAGTSIACLDVTAQIADERHSCRGHDSESRTVSRMISTCDQFDMVSFQSINYPRPRPRFFVAAFSNLSSECK